MEKKIKIQLLLGFIAMLAFTQSVKAQIPLTNPFKISNNLSCDITISYEITQCPNNFCGSGGTFVLPAYTTHYIYTTSSPCPLPIMGDVFVYIWEVDGVDVTSQWPTVSCQCGINCLASQGTSYGFNVPSPSACTTVKMAWYPWGVDINP